MRRTGIAGAGSPAVISVFSWESPLVPSHLVEYPVPHNEETGDDHICEQSRSKERCHDDDLVVHHRAHLLTQGRDTVRPRLDPGPDRVILV